MIAYLGKTRDHMCRRIFDLETILPKFGQISFSCTRFSCRSSGVATLVRDGPFESRISSRGEVSKKIYCE